jgi:peptidoglycan/LPS O-acetylase OafA/YrhL
VWKFTFWNEKLETSPQRYVLIFRLPRLTPLLAIFVGIIAVSLLAMGLLLLTKMHHQHIDSLFFTVFFALAGTIRALYVLCRSTDTLREVRSLLLCSTHLPGYD